MDAIESKRVTRAPKVIGSKIKKVGGLYIALEELFITIPGFYVNKHLATIDTTTSTLGVLSIHDNDNNYSILTIPSTVEITPLLIDNITVDDEPCFKLVIEKGAPLFNSNSIVVNGDNTFKVFNTFLVQGSVPWFLNYEDVMKTFSNLRKYTGSKIADDLLIFEILTSIAAVDSNSNPYRYTVTSNKDKNKVIINWLGIKNNISSTFAKVTGSYYNKGIISAITDDEIKPATNVEKQVRG